MRPNIILYAGLILLGACTTTPQVKYDSDPAANFAQYRSYSWALSAPPSTMNPLMFQRVKDTIDRTLASKGFTASDNGNFAVAFTLGARDRTEVTQLGGYGPYYRPVVGWGGMGGWSTMNSVDVRNVTDGTLAIDIYDAATKRPVWHGTAKQEISGDAVSQATLDSAVSAVLANFPPPPAKK